MKTFNQNNIRTISWPLSLLNGGEIKGASVVSLITIEAYTCIIRIPKRELGNCVNAPIVWKYLALNAPGIYVGMCYVYIVYVCVCGWVQLTY